MFEYSALVAAVVQSAEESYFQHSLLNCSLEVAASLRAKREQSRQEAIEERRHCEMIEATRALERASLAASNSQASSPSIIYENTAFLPLFVPVFL